jgi:hypothetical protein
MELRKLSLEMNLIAPIFILRLSRAMLLTVLA